jgi:hypothetical protein
MEGIHQGLRCSRVCLPLDPVMAEAVRANGLVRVVCSLSELCDARIAHGDHAEDWEAAREHLSRFLYSYTMEE